MKSVNKIRICSLAFIGIVFTSFSFISERNAQGPYFGNGFHNGWADQNSIIIWTRLTEAPEANFSGVKFLVPSVEEQRELSKEANALKIYEKQIPEGLTLHQMEGACPGANGEVKLIYYPFNEPNNKTELDWKTVDVNKNFTAQWKLENLKPDTKYLVEINARKDKKSGLSDKINGTFITPPEKATQKPLSFCITTCHDYWRRDTTGGHKIYDPMLRMSPDFYVHTGDIEYYDVPEPYAMTEELMRFKWDRYFALPLQRNFFGQITTYFMKDDHDMLCDDAFPGKKYGNVSFVRGLEIFDEQLPSNNKPYKTIRWGKDLQIWILEGRNFRSKNTDPDGPDKTILGLEQKKWLFDTLKKSDATYKLIISPTPILGPDRENKHDNYSNKNWKYEGDEIRTYLNQFDNVFICNGDRHWQYVTHYEGTHLWEFGCGAGADKHAGGWEPTDIRPEHRFLRVKGGFLGGDIYYENSIPVLRFRHYDVNGHMVHEEVFQR